MADLDDIDPTMEPPVRRSYGGFFANCLTGGVLLATLAVVGVYALVFINPYIPFNPYPPPTLPPTLGPPTPTPTPGIFLPTARAATATSTPTEATTAVVPTAPPTGSPTPTQATPEATPTGEAFEPQPGSPVLTPNIANDLGCDWMGVGGQAFDLQGDPIVGLSVHLEGTLQGQEYDLDTLTGSAPNLGPGGYVFDLAEQPIASDETIWVQLQDTAGVALSEPLQLTTASNCEENFVLVNWNQVR